MLAEEIGRRNVGKEIARLRGERGWTKEQLAVYADVSHVTIYKVERGENATYRTLHKIAGALNVPVAKLVE